LKLPKPDIPGVYSRFNPGIAWLWVYTTACYTGIEPIQQTVLRFHENQYPNTQIWERTVHLLQYLVRLSLPPSVGR